VGHDRREAVVVERSAMTLDTYADLFDDALDVARSLAHSSSTDRAHMLRQQRTSGDRA